MRWLSVPAVLMLAACSMTSYDGGPSRAQLDAIRAAQNVYPANYKADVLAFLRNYLNDPTNIRGAGIAEPQRKPLVSGERYVACLRYNARKANGQYAGSKTAVVVFVSGKLDRLAEDQETRDLCKDAAYSPFPELERLTR